MFAQEEDWTLLCDALASGPLTAGNTLAATLCYVCAGNIHKTVEIWSYNLESEHEGRSYVDLLQDFNGEDDCPGSCNWTEVACASLSKLVENYAALLPTQGLLSTAME
ncbi:putative protein transport protein SEC31 [Dioscorea sansibarensis]